MTLQRKNSKTCVLLKVQEVNLTLWLFCYGSFFFGTRSGATAKEPRL